MSLLESIRSYFGGLPADVMLPCLAFLVGAATLWVLCRLLVRKPRVVDRRLMSAGPGRDAEDRPHDGIFGGFTPALAAQIPESKKELKEFRKMLRGAGLYSPTAALSIYALRFMLLAVPLVLAGLIAVTGDPDDALRTMLVGTFVAVTLSIVPRLYVYLRRRARLAEIRDGLPEVMDMLAMCLEGGMSVSSSLLHVARQLKTYPSLAQELLILRRQADVSSLKQALADMSQRVDLPEVRSLSALLTRGDQLGTRLSGSLLDQSDHLRVSRRQRATMKANKTPVKLVFPLLFCFAPAALILLVSPAVLELREFISPRSGQGVLAGNEELSTESLFTTLDSLDQELAE